MDYLSARITLTNNAAGTLSYRVSWIDESVSGEFYHSRIDVPITAVPEPASVILVGLLGLCGLTRVRY